MLKSNFKKLIAKNFPWCVYLIGLTYVFSAFASFTSNTGNILAWGFDGLWSIKKPNPGLICYEFAHGSSAYFAHLLGLLLVLLVSIVLYAFDYDSKRCLFWTCCVIPALAVISFVIINGILFHYPDDTYFNKYLEMALSMPYGIEEFFDRPGILIFFLPLLILGISSIAFPKFRDLLGTPLAFISSLGGVICLWIAINYDSYHFLCYDNPEIYTSFFRQLFWPLILTPSILYLLAVWFFTRRSV